MKLYDSIGPNPRVVRMAMAEKGMSLPTETIDIMAGANRSGDYIKKVPAGGTPCLARIKKATGSPRMRSTLSKPVLPTLAPHRVSTTLASSSQATHHTARRLAEPVGKSMAA